jgi:hypothetical protein
LGCSEHGNGNLPLRVTLESSKEVTQTVTQQLHNGWNFPSTFLPLQVLPKATLYLFDHLFFSLLLFALSTGGLFWKNNDEREIFAVGIS